MFQSIDEFLTLWDHESKSTQKMLDILTDESLTQKVSPQDRTLGRIAWHIVTTLHEMLSLTGLTFEGALHESPMPASAKEIAESYRVTNHNMIVAIKEQWTNDTLSEVDNMYDEQWSKGTTLFILISHQNHHRGQMTVLMRQAGLTVPGVYGPSREEWAEFGMETPSI